MGNNSTSGEVESSIKICFQELDSGRMTDIHPNSGNSFSTRCNGGLASSDYSYSLLLETAIVYCTKFKMEILQQLSANVDFAPGLTWLHRS